MSSLKETKLPSFPSFSEEEFDYSSSNQGEEYTSESSENRSENYSSTEDEEEITSEEFDDGSDFSVDEVLSFEPIHPSTTTNTRQLPKSTLGTSSTEPLPKSQSTIIKTNNVDVNKLEKRTTSSTLTLTSSINSDKHNGVGYPAKSPLPTRKNIPPPPPPPPPHKKVQLTRDEIKKLEIENNKLKNKFGFIRKEDFLFCCFTSAKTKSLRFFKRLIVLEEGTMLCHLTSSSPSFLYYTKDGSIFEEEDERTSKTSNGVNRQIKTIKYDYYKHSKRKSSINGYEDEEDDSERENLLLNSNLDESSDENILKTLNKSKNNSKNNNNNSHDSSDEEAAAKKYKYELIYLRNCIISQIIFDEVDKKYFFHISSNTSPKKYFFLSDDVASLYLWFLAIRSNIQNSAEFQSNNNNNNEPAPIHYLSSPNPYSDSSSASLTSSLLLFADTSSIQKTLGYYSPNHTAQSKHSSNPPSSSTLSTSSQSRSSKLLPNYNHYNNSEISTNYTCYSVTPPSPSPSPSPTSSPLVPRQRSPRHSPRSKRSHRRHVSLTISPSLDQYPLLPPHPSPKLKKHKKKKKNIAQSSPHSNNVNHFDISSLTHYHHPSSSSIDNNNKDKLKPILKNGTTSQSNNINNNNINNNTANNNSVNEINGKTVNDNNDNVNNSSVNNNCKTNEKVNKVVFDKSVEKYAADDEGEVKLPLKKPTPFFILPYIKNSTSTQTSSDTPSLPPTQSSNQPSRLEKAKSIIHGYDIPDPNNNTLNNNERNNFMRSVPPNIDLYAKPSQWRKSLPPRPKSPSAFDVPEVEELDFSFLDLKKK